MCPPGPLSLVCIVSCPPTACTAARELPSICSYDFHHSPSGVPASLSHPPPQVTGNNSGWKQLCFPIGLQIPEPRPFSPLHGAAVQREGEATSHPAAGEEERAPNMQLAHSGDKLCSLPCPPCLELYRTVQPTKADQCDSMCHTVSSLGKLPGTANAIWGYHFT